jgi:hypothetical protein
MPSFSPRFLYSEPHFPGFVPTVTWGNGYYLYGVGVKMNEVIHLLHWTEVCC